MAKIKKIASLLTAVFLIGIIFLFLYQRLRLGLVRFMDLDEVMHLHWAYNAYVGKLPYKDFFYIFTPFYLYVLAPIVYISGKTFAFVTTARILTFIFYCIGTFFLFLIAKKNKNMFFTLLTIFIFTYLPLPADKWLEVRPDGLGTVIGLIGIWLLINGIASAKTVFYLTSGFFISLGVVVNPKILFYPLAAAVVAGADIVLKPVRTPKRWLLFLLGLTIPVVFLFLLLFFAFGDFRRAIFSAFIFQQYSGAIYNTKYPIAPNQFFYPNEIYYGSAGFTFNYFANLVIYVAATLTAIVVLISFLTESSKERALLRLLLALLFLTNLIGYIKFFPLKFTQYLIGASPFVAYFFAEFISYLGEKIKRRGLAVKGIAYGIFGILIVFMAIYGTKMNQTKMVRTNEESFGVLQNAKENLAEDEYVWDLTGNSLFYKDPYYICCLPYGDYPDAFNFSFPNLEKALREHEVAHIFFTYPGRLATIPTEHLAIINQFYVMTRENYSVMFAGADINLSSEKKEGKFEMITGGWYKIYLDDKFWPVDDIQKSILLDGKIILSNPIYLSKGKYSLMNIDNKKLQIKLLYTRK